MRRRPYDAMQTVAQRSAAQKAAVVRPICSQCRKPASASLPRRLRRPGAVCQRRGCGDGTLMKVVEQKG